ncbi:PAS domain-containing protein [Streptomyces sp. B93]|uniref:SpoIIE family protein phosphatase n=1 Tax=Streptomyces sp. B93 TaxID=2824875 RepID=UPI001B398CCC|nr:PAS domain-containing protein [Streptomyces sp. B93]MBQ1091943.1 PAS domain-containing protein [Streptomyces sp. B93]
MSTPHTAERRSSARRPHTDAELVVDRHGTVVGWSTAAHDLLGFTESEVRGRPVSALLAPKRPLALDGSAAAEEDASAAVVLRDRDGRARACRVRIRPTDRPPGGWTVLVTPVTAAPEGRTVDEALLDTLFNQSPTSLCVYDSDLRLRRCNPAARGLEGLFADDSIGRMPHELWPDSNSTEFEGRMREVLESGTPVLDFDKHGRPPDDPGHEHVFANSIFRLEDPAGQVVGLATTAVEITAQRVAEERIALLADASTLIGTSLDVVETGQQLADVVVPRFADAATVDVLAPVLSGAEPDPSRAGLLRVGLRYADDTAAPDRTDRTGRPVLPFPASDGGQLAGLEPRRADILLPDDGEPLYRGTRGERPAHSLVVPMRVRDTVVGVVTYYRFDPDGGFSDFDVLTARDLSSRAAVSIDNARRYTREHCAARALQRELLPRHADEQSAVRTAHYFAAATTGANWFDVIPVSGARVALVVGTTDESGLSGAAAIGRLGTAVHALTDLDLDPAEVLARLDALVTRIAGGGGAGAAARDGGEGSRITCTYAVYDPATGRLSLASAGQPAPLVATPDGGVRPLTASAGPPLGAAGRQTAAEDVDLPADSTLMFYTPALAPDRGPDGERPRSLTAPLASASGRSLAELREDVLAAASGDGPAPPGAVLLLARTRRLDENHMSAWDLPSDPAVVATARNLVQRQLDVWGLEETAFVTELVVSELVTNAIRYAEGPIGLRIIHDQHTLICEVSDGSTTAPHLRYARTGDEGGRGLFLVAQLTQRWGTRFSDTGKTIWTEQDVADEAPL